MPALDWITRVASEVDQVAHFHAAPMIIRRLTPWVVPMSMHRMDPLREGSISEFTLWFGFIPVRWTALHVGVDPQTGFIDIQQVGPFRLWIHRHRFEPDPLGGARIVEHVDFQHDSGWSGWLTRVLFSPPMLFLLFSFRSLVMQRTLGRPNSTRPASAA